MKITRNQFLKLIPAAALALSGCSSKTEPANTESLVFSHHYQLDYAQQFTADCYEGGYTMVSIPDSGQKFLVVPQDAAEVDSLPADVTVLRQPVENIYLVSTSVMDLILHLDALDSITPPAPRPRDGICPKQSRPWKRAASPMQASTAPRTTNKFWPRTAALPSRTP